MKIVLYVLLGLLALVLLLLLTPSYAYVAYEGGLTVAVRVLGIKKQIYPMKRKKRQKKTQTPEEKKDSESKKEKRKLSVSALTDYVRLGIDAVGRICRCIRITKLYLHANVGDEDPGKTAMTYGASAAAVSTLLPMIESTFRTKGVDVEINADFGGQNNICAELALSSILMCLFLAALKILIRFMKVQNKHKNKHKGGKRNG